MLFYLSAVTEVTDYTETRNICTPLLLPINQENRIMRTVMPPKTGLIMELQTTVWCKNRNVQYHWYPKSVTGYDCEPVSSISHSYSDFSMIHLISDYLLSLPNGYSNRLPQKSVCIYCFSIQATCSAHNNLLDITPETAFVTCICHEVPYCVIPFPYFLWPT